MFSIEELQKIIKTAMGSKGDYADIFISQKSSTSIMAEDNRIKTFYSGFSEGAGIRVMSGTFSAYLYTNSLTLESLLALAKAGSEAIVMGNDGKIHDLSEKYKSSLIVENVDSDVKGNIVKYANQCGWNSGNNIKQLNVVYGDTLSNVIIANSNGNIIRDRIARKKMYIESTMVVNGQWQTAVETFGNSNAKYDVDENVVKNMVDKVLTRNELLVGAKPAPSGSMPVVMSSEAGGTMVHEACGHGLEADIVQKGMSVYKDKIGQMVAMPTISVIDDATIPDSYGSYVYDDEGNPGRRNVLIDNGKLVNYMYDIDSARKGNTVSTGNGRRESYQHKPQVRMSNTLILSGADEPAEILANTKSGLFVRKMGGGQVNTTNGDFVFQVAEGYMIEDGQITYPVRNATLIGNGPDVLMNIDRVGNDLDYAIGTCGKGGQGVPVGDGQPTIRVKELVIGGAGE